MARIRTRGNIIDVKLLANDLRDIPAEIQKKAQIETEAALRDILSELKANSTLRLSNVVGANKIRHSRHIASGHPSNTFNPQVASSGTKDRPFENARVVNRQTNPKTRGLGNRRLNVYVDMDDGNGTNFFNVLDAGVNIRTQNGNPTFPIYTKSATKPMIQYSPDKVGSYFRQAELDIDENGRIKMVTLPQGYRMKKRMRARGYYSAVAFYVADALVGMSIPLSSGRSYKISEEDVQNIIIRVSDGARLKKISK